MAVTEHLNTQGEICCSMDESASSQIWIWEKCEPKRKVVYVQLRWKDNLGNILESVMYCCFLILQF